MKTKGAARSRNSNRRLRALGLRLCKHRSYCPTCKDLTKHGVGGGGPPVCLECLP